MLYNGADCGIFNNDKLLTNITKSQTTAKINGRGGTITTNLIGTYRQRHTVFYHPDVLVNIISHSHEVDNGATIIYNTNEDYFTLLYEEDAYSIDFSRYGGLYCHE